MVANPHYVRVPHPRSGRLRSFDSFWPFYLGECCLLGGRGALSGQLGWLGCVGQAGSARDTPAERQALAAARRSPLARPCLPGEHSNRTCRRLHLLGTSAVLVLLGAAAVTRQPRLVLAALPAGYGSAWLGHLCFERNWPATWTYPLWSFRADLRMWGEVLAGQRAF